MGNDKYGIDFGLKHNNFEIILYPNSSVEKSIEDNKLIFLRPTEERIKNDLQYLD